MEDRRLRLLEFRDGKACRVLSRWTRTFLGHRRRLLGPLPTWVPPPWRRASKTCSFTLSTQRFPKCPQLALSQAIPVGSLTGEQFSLIRVRLDKPSSRLNWPDTWLGPRGLSLPTLVKLYDSK